MLTSFIVLIWVHLSLASHGIDDSIAVNDDAIRGVHLKVYGYEVYRLKHN